MGPIQYRPAGVEDVPDLVKLRLRQLQDEGAEPEYELEPYLQEYYAGHLADGTFLSWLALDGIRVVATSGLSFLLKPPYYANPAGIIGMVSNMYTTDAYRRQGIAKKLLGLLAEEAKKHGCHVLQVSASDMGVSLYRDFGFQERKNFLEYKIR